MTVFIVTQEGKYRHNILGVYTEERSARKRALQCAKLEVDGYHDYQVSTAIINGPCDDVNHTGHYIYNQKDKTWEWIFSES